MDASASLSFVELDAMYTAEPRFARDALENPDLRTLRVSGSHGEYVAHWVCRRDLHAARYAMEDPAILALTDARGRSVAHVCAAAWEALAHVAIEDEHIAWIQDLHGRVVAHDAVFFWESVAFRVAIEGVLETRGHPRAESLRDYARRRLEGEDPENPLPARPLD